MLDLFRVVPADRDVAIRDLVDIAGLFDLTGNATRVAVARLARDGILASSRRGRYRLSPSAARLGDWVESWRLGDDRMRRWDGAWLAAALPPGLDRLERARTLRALDRFGFKIELSNLAVRPDNLAADRSELREQLDDQGGARTLELMVISELSEPLARRFAALWPVDALIEERRRQAAALRESARDLRERPPAEALVESFSLGGAAIRLLARDPLLPEAIAPGDARRELTAAMLAYDKLGRSLWADALEVARAPAHLAEVAGA